MKKWARRIGIPVVLCMCIAVAAVGCNAASKVGEIAQKTYTVLQETEAVLLETEQLIAGSELADRLGPKIDAIQDAIGAVKNTLKTITDLLNHELNMDVQVYAADAKPAVDRLQSAIEELQAVNDKYRAEVD